MVGLLLVSFLTTDPPQVENFSEVSSFSQVGMFPEGFSLQLLNLKCLLQLRIFFTLSQLGSGSMTILE